jgi:hypothetical protein
MTGGVEVASAEALSAQLSSSLSNVGIERLSRARSLRDVAPNVAPTLLGGDQRVRSFAPNPLILLAPRAGLEPATKRLTAGRPPSKGACSSSRRR